MTTNNASVHSARSISVHKLPAMGLVLLLALILVPTVLAASGEVLGQQKISDTEGGFLGGLEDADRFGTAVTVLGDLDGNGVDDLAVGTPSDDDGGPERGAVWILFLNSDGTVLAEQKISDTSGGFTGGLHDIDLFGVSANSIGDLDGDGVTDLAVGAYRDGDGGLERGAVWVLFLNSDGTVKGHQKISDISGGFSGGLIDGDRFGASIANLGDRDGDGVTDLAVGAYKDDDGGTDRGAVWILFLNNDGTVKAQQKISDTSGGFTGGLSDTDHFGSAVVPVGDLDGDGVTDLAVGAYQSDGGGTERGAVWTLLLNSDLTVKSQQLIGDSAGGFTGLLEDEDRFGVALAPIGDLDGDGIADLAVGAYRDDDGGLDRGAIWMLFLDSGGSVKAQQKISDSVGGFAGGLDNEDRIGASLTGLGDLDGDGIADLAAGAYQDGDGGPLRGAVWILFLDGIPDNLIMADLNCVPSTGTLPFTAQMTVTFTNTYTGQSRWLAGTVDLTLASGTHFSNYRAGHTVVAAGGYRAFTWDQYLPALGTLRGDNRARLVARDVTPAPYNQPPYPPSGDVETSSCTVTGRAP
jgi:hypothetical protein